jgi:hypothetical protein
MSTPEFTGEQPDHLLALATAIADRDTIEGTWALGVLTGNQNPELLPRPELMRRIQIGTTAYTLERLEQPDTPSDPQTLLDRLVDDGLIREAIIGAGQDPTDEAIAITRAGVLRSLERVEGFKGGSAAEAAAFKARLQTANMVAALRGVDITEVFTDHALYCELMRNLYTPQQLANEGLAHIDKAVEAREDPDGYRRAYSLLIIQKIRRYWSTENLSDLDTDTLLQLIANLR